MFDCATFQVESESFAQSADQVQLFAPRICLLAPLQPVVTGRQSRRLPVNALL
jgi:hypothetical protein